MSSVLEHTGGLVALAGGERCAKRETDDDANRDAGSGENLGRGGGPERIDHRAGKAVLGGLVAELNDLSARGLGFEQGVVEHGGQRRG